LEKRTKLCHFKHTGVLVVIRGENAVERRTKRSPKGKNWALSGTYKKRPPTGVS